MRKMLGLMAFAFVAVHGPLARAQRPLPPAPAPPTAPAPVAAPSVPAPAAFPAAPARPAPGPLAVAPLADSLTGSARGDYDAARMLFGVSDYAGALIKFTNAYKTSQDPRLLYELAVCENKMHHYAQSLGYMQRYVKDSASLLSAQDQADAAQAIAAMQPLTSNIHVGANEAGADVYVDERLIGQSPLPPFLIDIGVHTVRVHKPEFQDFSVELTVTGGALISVDALVTRVVHAGRLSVRTGPQDAVAVDGKPIGTGGWAGPLPSGGHTLRVSAPGMIPYQTEVLIQDGQARDMSVTLNPEPSRGLLPAWAWVAGGVVVAGGLGVGAYFVFKPSSQYTGPAGTLAPGIVQANAPVHF
jgi:hypothetical protein